MPTQLDNKVTLFIANMNKVNDLVHGDETVVVQTDTGPVPSIRKAIADGLDPEIQAAITAKNQALGYRDAAEGFKNEASDFKNQASTFRNEAGGFSSTASQTLTDINSTIATATGVINSKVTQATDASNLAVTARNKSQEWADKAANVEVEPGKYSARHWAQLVASALTGGLSWREGGWDASTGVFPSPIDVDKAGDFYEVTVGGTIGGFVFLVGDSIVYRGDGTYHHIAGALGYVAANAAVSMIPRGVVYSHLTDLNTLLIPGIYQVAGNGSWGAGLNGPSTASPYGQLSVTTTGTVTTQIFVTQDDSEVWVRTTDDQVAWRLWKHTLNSSTAQISDIQGLTTALGLKVDLAATGASVLISNTNLDVLNRTGFYRGVSLGNAPQLDVGWFFVSHQKHTDLWMTQTAISMGTALGNVTPVNSVFTRTQENYVWTAWEQAITDINAEVLLSDIISIARRLKFEKFIGFSI